jgi:hypothetical protein
VEPLWARLDHHVKVRLPITLAVVVISVTASGLLTEPSRRTPGYGPEQPIAFSHALHAGTMKVECRYCHSGVETGRHATVPASQICMNCHSVAATERPGVAALRALYEEDKPVAWKRIHKLPDFVYFAHDVHVAAGIDCESCHGRMTRASLVRQVHLLSMGSCLDCHRHAPRRIAGVSADLRGPEHCSACHR